MIMFLLSIITESLFSVHSTSDVIKVYNTMLFYLNLLLLLHVLNNVLSFLLLRKNHRFYHKEPT